jgi:hypothetical protein
VSVFYVASSTINVESRRGKTVIITGGDAKFVLDGEAGSLSAVMEDNFDWAQGRAKTKADLHILFTTSEHFSSILIDNRQLRGVRVIIVSFS